MDFSKDIRICKKNFIIWFLGPYSAQKIDRKKISDNRLISTYWYDFQIQHLILSTLRFRTKLYGTGTGLRQYLLLHCFRMSRPKFKVDFVSTFVQIRLDAELIWKKRTAFTFSQIFTSNGWVEIYSFKSFLCIIH